MTCIVEIKFLLWNCSYIGNAVSSESDGTSSNLDIGILN